MIALGVIFFPYRGKKIGEKSLKIWRVTKIFPDQIFPRLVLFPDFFFTRPVFLPNFFSLNSLYSWNYTGLVDDKEDNENSTDDEEYVCVNDEND